MDLTIKTIVTNGIGENAYVVCAPALKRSFVIDPGGAVESIIKESCDKGCSITDILLTHGHFDHILGLGKLEESTGADIYIHELDSPMLTDSELSMGQAFGIDSTQVAANHLLNAADTSRIEICGQAIDVLHTPGHTRGSVCYYLPEQGILFSGDTLFRQGYGRTDFPGGSERELTSSLVRLLRLPGETAVYSGHGAVTTIASEAGAAPW